MSFLHPVDLFSYLEMRLIQFVQVCSSVETRLGLKSEEKLFQAIFNQQSSIPAFVQHLHYFDFKYFPFKNHRGLGYYMDIKGTFP